MISQGIFHEMVPHASDRIIQKFYSPVCETMRKFNINTKYRIAAFIAQLTHESGSFHYMEEIASGEAYDNRKDLGNDHPIAKLVAKEKGTSTGKLYKGRSPIQITGFYNYEHYGELLDLDLIHEPELLCLPKWGCLAAGHFWNEHNLNKFADADDIRKITRIINGGTNGLTQRKLYYETNKRILSSIFK